MKLAILGFGVEGLSAYNHFKDQEGIEITIFDAAKVPRIPLPDTVRFVSIENNDFGDLHGFDKLIRTPSIAPSRIVTDGEISSVMQEFFGLCPTRNIIGVTGTKGKGTISTLIRDILQQAGKRVHLAGNVGISVLDILPEVQPDDIVVIELSSFQLWDMQVSPHVAVVGMIEPEHLEIHADFADYLAAKANIAKWQQPDDVVVYHPTNEFSAQIAQQSKGRKIRYNTPEGAQILYGDIVVQGHAVAARGEVQIPGEHNLENICAAVTAAWQFIKNTGAIRRAIKEFTGLEHRLEFVREIGGVEYYNDSISTTPGSVRAALNSFTPANEILIIGGQYDKGVDFSDLAAELARQKPKKVWFVGPMGQKIFELARSAGYQNGELLLEWRMSEVVRKAAAIAEPGDFVVLSPAVASFGDFNNYQERGQKFKEAVEELQ